MTLVAGSVGGLIFAKARVPAGFMVGSMVFTTILSLAAGHHDMPEGFRIITQITAGALIGSAVEYKDLIALKKIILPAFQMMGLMIFLDILMGFLMFAVTELDLPTSLMASAPGGMMDISLMSADLGADPGKVAILQLLRLMTVMAVFPILMKTVSRKTAGNQDLVQAQEELHLREEEKDRLKSNWSLHRRKRTNLLITLSLAATAGYLGYWLKVPAGALTFSMPAVAALNIFTGRGLMTAQLKSAVQILAGVLIGVRVTYGDILSLRTILLPAGILLIGIIAINLFVGYILHKTTGLDLITSLIASVPGGVTDMALIARELGADQSKVAILQLFRYVFVIGLYPAVIRILLSLVG